jgi:hypothetical protein
VIEELEPVDRFGRVLIAQRLVHGTAPARGNPDEVICPNDGADPDGDECSNQLAGVLYSRLRAQNGQMNSVDQYSRD